MCGRRLSPSAISHVLPNPASQEIFHNKRCACLCSEPVRNHYPVFQPILINYQTRLRLKISRCKH